MIDPGDVRARLGAVIDAMQRAGVWDVARPADAAFARMGAFGAPTMAFSQWLRWVFVPTVEELIAAGGPWPADSSVAVQAVREGDTSPPLAELVPALSAFDALFTASRPAPPAPGADNEVGWALLQKPDRTPADVEQAIRLFRRSIEHDPATPQAAANLGTALVDLGRDADAIAELEQIAAGDGALAGVAHNWLGWKLGKDDPRRAIGHLREATRLRPTWGVAWLNLARALDASGDAAEGCRAYTEAVTCGDSHDDTFARDRRLQLEMQMVANGETPPPVPVSARADSAAFAIVRATAARVPIPQRFAIRTTTRESQAAIIGALAEGRALGHMIVGATDTTVAVTTLDTSQDPHAFHQVVFAADDVRDANRRQVIEAAERLLPRLAAPDIAGIEPIEAAMFLRDSVLPSAGSRWRWDLASHRPAAIEVAEVAGELGLIVRARAGGGVEVQLAPGGVGQPPEVLAATTPQQMIELGERITEATRRALAARDVFAARPFGIRQVVARLQTFHRFEAPLVGPPYPAWPTAVLKDQRRHLEVVALAESASGVVIQSGRAGPWTVDSVAALEALLPALGDAIRADLERVRIERLEPNDRYRVIKTFRGLEPGTLVELTDVSYEERDAYPCYRFGASSGRTVVLHAASEHDYALLTDLDLYLATL